MVVMAAVLAAEFIIGAHHTGRASLDAVLEVAMCHGRANVHGRPLVEVVGGERTDPDALAAARRIYTGLGMHPLLLRKEIDGFILNRLQGALLNEAMRLIADGYVTTADLDMQRHYRTEQNVLGRPARTASGRSFRLIGHHEINVPLLALAIERAAGAKS